jgi:phosphoribosylaminoimidazolecarboxamide formyltransferase/IMP cyclohydrolase
VINRVEKIDGHVAVKNVIISVADKTGLETFVPALVGSCPDVSIYSTGGTYKRIKEILGPKSGDHLISVSDYTRQPEMQGGLVKTLDYRIYIGLLSEPYNTDHERDIDRLGAVNFDMVVVNLYPFHRKISEDEVSTEDARSFIDIGGPCMLRAAAKNFIRVASVCDPSDYAALIDELSGSGGMISLWRRYQLAEKAFRHTAEYDAEISAYFATQPFSLACEAYSVSGDTG